MTAKAQKNCKDCVAGSTRPAVWPGPRCKTHWLAEQKRRKQNAHALHVARNYAITRDEYKMLYVAQGGRCYVCRKATGKTKHLAVDHDHGCLAGHPPEQGCRLCVRALLCSRCNRTIGFLDELALARAIDVLLYRPAQRVLAR